PKWSLVINLWYDELQIAPNSVVHNFDSHGLNIGHFTQIAWASSRKIGCGFVAFRLVGSVYNVAHLYTCNYAPSGNHLGAAMYLAGTPLSHCPHFAQPSKKYSALCSYSNLEHHKELNKKQNSTHFARKTKFNRYPSENVPDSELELKIMSKISSKLINCLRNHFFCTSLDTIDFIFLERFDSNSVFT
ncbi:vespid v5 venom allergen-like protein, partial [Dinothrombium tinctorium]